MPDTLQIRAISALASLEDAEQAAEAYLAYKAARSEALSHIRQLDAAAEECLVPWLSENGPMEVGDTRLWAGKDTKTRQAADNRAVADAVLAAVEGDMDELYRALTARAFKQAHVRQLVGDRAWTELYDTEVGEKLRVKEIPIKMLGGR